MSAANDDGPKDRVLADGLDVEELALDLGLTEDVVRKVCYNHSKKILERMRSIAEESIIEFAHNDGLVKLGVPEELEGFDASILWKPEIKLVPTMVPAEYKESLRRQIEGRKLRKIQRHKSPASIVMYDDEDDTHIKK